VVIAVCSCSPLYLVYELSKREIIDKQLFQSDLTQNNMYMPLWVVIVFGIIGFALSINLGLLDIYTIIIFTLFFCGGIAWQILSKIGNGGM
jgi:hypothetical protein